jgi:hypothetical protein
MNRVSWRVLWLRRARISLSTVILIMRPINEMLDEISSFVSDRNLVDQRSVSLKVVDSVPSPLSTATICQRLSGIDPLSPNGI